MNYCRQCGNKLSAGNLFCNACGYQVSQRQPKLTAEPNPKGKNKKSTVVIIALTLFAMFFMCIIFGEQIATQISYWINPSSIIVSYKAQIPEGVTKEQITDNMKKIVEITKRRLKALGYYNATVSVDNNTLTIKHIPEKADISAVTEYISSLSYAAEFRDLDGNTILSNAEFTSATARAGVDSDTKYEISIFFNSETREKFSKKLKEIASLEDGKNYILLVANDIVIVNILVNPEHAQTGWETNEISFRVPDNGDQFDLTAEELEKALNSGGTLPFALTNVKIIGTDSTSTGDAEIPWQDVPEIDLLKSLDEGKTLSEIFNSVEGTNHYNYIVLNGSKYELWVKGNKRKLIFTANGGGPPATYYNYDDTYYQYKDGIAIEDNISAEAVFDMYPIDAWEHTRIFFSANEDSTFVNIGSENINGEGCTVFNVMFTNKITDQTYRTARIYISNQYGCIVKHVSISGDSIGIEVTESTVVEYFGLNAYTFVDNDVTMPEGTKLIENPFK